MFALDENTYFTFQSCLQPGKDGVINFIHMTRACSSLYCFIGWTRCVAILSWL